MSVTSVLGVCYECVRSVLQVCYECVTSVLPLGLKVCCKCVTSVFLFFVFALQTLRDSVPPVCGIFFNLSLDLNGTHRKIIFSQNMVKMVV